MSDKLRTKKQRELNEFQKVRRLAEEKERKKEREKNGKWFRLSICESERESYGRKSVTAPAVPIIS